MARWRKIGIIAGGGTLPVRLAEACRQREDACFVIRLEGYADSVLEAFEGTTCNIAEIGKLIRLLKEADCDAVVLAGIVRRPNFSALKPDWRGAALLPKVIAAARRGDGALLDTMVGVFEAEGFLVIGAEEIAEDIFVPAGAIGQHAPTPRDFNDMAKAVDLIRALGPFDVGQGAVVRNGLVLAIEAAEGTDQMLRRCAELPSEVKGFEPGEMEQPRGVLLKRPKPGQELRVDLPTIGEETVRQVVAAGLAGIAIEAEAGLVIDIDRVRKAADAAGIFVFGYRQSDLAEGA